jgi:mannose-1-phosphate guanylyltransferase
MHEKGLNVNRFLARLAPTAIGRRCHQDTEGAITIDRPSLANERVSDVQPGLPSFWGVIPAGGAGTRLWPISRATRPKFLLPLLGDRSLLRQTVDRLAALTRPERTLVVCGPAHAADISRQLPELPTDNIIVEPAPRSSGPAIILAAALIARHDPDAVMGSFAADHDVRDDAAFARAVRTSIEAADAGYLVAIGLMPTRPETGYGYIERSDEIIAESSDGRAFRAACFVEKPDSPTAAEYVASGHFLWNASMFVWRVQVLLDEVKRLQPDLHAGITQIVGTWETSERENVAATVWASLPECSIDVGVMELAERVAVVPAEMGWSDVGDWHGLGNLLDRDPHGNSVRGELVQIGTTNSAVWSDTQRLIALVGLDNVIVVDTPDALLVADRAKAQQVRNIVDLVRNAGRLQQL